MDRKNSFIEVKELKSFPNFVGIFIERLHSIQPSDYSSWDFLKGLEEVGIAKVNKMGFAVIFVTTKQDGEDSCLQIWMKDERKTDRKYPHIDVREELVAYLDEHKIKYPTNFVRDRGIILQANNSDLFLLVNGQVGEIISQKVELSAGDKYSREWVISYENMMSRYGLLEIVAKGFSNSEEKKKLYGTKNIRVLNGDILEEITESRYLLSFAHNYAMTNSQFMRFRIRAISSRKAALTNKEAADKGIQYLLNLDELAKEIILEKTEEGYL